MFWYFPTGHAVHSLPLIYLPASHDSQTPVLKLHLDWVDETVRHVVEQAVQLDEPLDDEEIESEIESI